MPNQLADQLVMAPASSQLCTPFIVSLEEAFYPRCPGGDGGGGGGDHTHHYLVGRNRTQMSEFDSFQLNGDGGGSFNLSSIHPTNDHSAHQAMT
eukprot:gene26937-biopygen5932